MLYSKYLDWYVVRVDYHSFSRRNAFKIYTLELFIVEDPTCCKFSDTDMVV